MVFIHLSSWWTIFLLPGTAQPSAGPSRSFPTLSWWGSWDQSVFWGMWSEPAGAWRFFVLFWAPAGEWWHFCFSVWWPSWWLGWLWCFFIVHSVFLQCTSFSLSRSPSLAVFFFFLKPILQNYGQALSSFLITFLSGSSSSLGASVISFNYF